MSLERSDSLSRYQSNDLFHVGKPSEIKTEIFGKDIHIPKDSIDISREKIKEEALQRLKQPSKYLISQPGFIRIGKYLFMTITFPPYLLLYGLPKWVIVDAIPFLFTQSVQLVKRIKKKIQTPIQAVANKFARIVESLKNMGRLWVQPMIRLALDIRNGMRRMNQHVIRLFKQFKGSVLRLVNFPGTVLSRLSFGMRTRREKIREKMTHSTKWFSKKLDDGFSTIQQGIRRIKEASQAFLGWLQNPMQKWSEKGIAWKSKIVRPYNASCERARKVTTQILQQLKRAQRKIMRALDPLICSYRTHVLSHWHQIKKGFQSSWKVIKDFLNKKQHQTSCFLQGKREKLKKLSYPHMLDRFLSNRLFLRMPSKIQEFLKRFLYHPVIISLCGKMIAGFKNVGEYVLRAILFIIEAVVKLIKKSAYISAKIVKYWLMGKQKCLQCCAKANKIFGNVFKKCVYYTLLILIMTGILVVWGIKLLGEFTNYLTSKIPLIRSSNRA